MRTRVLQIDPTRPDIEAMAEAAAVIRAGGLVAFPTETVYGLGVDAGNDRAIRRLFEAKGRPPTNPLIVHVRDEGHAREVVAEWPNAAKLLADRFWPGPLTMVLRKSDAISHLVTAGKETVGVRVPAVLVARNLIESTGRPIAAPSANRSNRLSPTTAAHVMKDLDGRIELILDAGGTEVGLESTVIDLSCGPPYRVLRPGPVRSEALESVLEPHLVDAKGRVEVETGDAARSPGLFPVHYAPQTPTWRFEIGETPHQAGFAHQIAVLEIGPPGASLEDLESRIAQYLLLREPEECASRLYATLHELDELGLDAIWIRMPPQTPAWEAVRDRLRRASRPMSEIR